MVISHHSDKRTLGQAFLNNQHARRFLVRILIAFSIIQPIGDCFGYSSQIWINFDKSQYSECHSVMKQTYLCQPASLELVTLDQGSINLEILNICRPPVSPSDRVKRVNVLVTVSQQPRVVPAPSYCTGQQVLAKLGKFAPCVNFISLYWLGWVDTISFCVQDMTEYLTEHIPHSLHSCTTTCSVSTLSRQQIFIKQDINTSHRTQPPGHEFLVKHAKNYILHQTLSCQLMVQFVNLFIWTQISQSNKRSWNTQNYSSLIFTALVKRRL